MAATPTPARGRAADRGILRAHQMISDFTKIMFYLSQVSIFYELHPSPPWAQAARTCWDKEKKHWKRCTQHATPSWGLNMSLYNKTKKRNGTKKELLCSSSMKPELTNTHLRSQHDALCLIFRQPHEAMIDLLHNVICSNQSGTLFLDSQIP